MVKDLSGKVIQQGDICLFAVVRGILVVGVFDRTTVSKSETYAAEYYTEYAHFKTYNVFSKKTSNSKVEIGKWTDYDGVNRHCAERKQRFWILTRDDVAVRFGQDALDNLDKVKLSKEK